MATVEVGYNVRRWTTFQIKDATPEELEVLSGAVQNDYQPEPFTLLTEMEAAGRLTEIDSSTETGGEQFTRYVDPNIIEVDE